MKRSIPFLLYFILIFSGCGSRNAFSVFHVDQKQQKTFANFKVSKIMDANSSVGTVSAVYLNNISPEKYKNGEYFYVVSYTKEDKPLHFTLNGKNPIYVTQLQADNIYKNLLSISDMWHSYFLVEFPVADNEHLSLVVSQTTARSYALTYLKNSQ
jgi:hypothetical protein